MKIPSSPPKTNELIHKILRLNKEKDILDKMILYGSTPQQKEYLHWDKLRHLKPAKDLSIEETWLATKLARLKMYKQLIFKDKNNLPFQFTTPDKVQYKLYEIDQHFGRVVQNTASIFNPEWKDTYLVNSLIEEAITSSQLEGASTTRKAAEAMLRSQRKPVNHSEQMIVNNYHAMQFIREMKNEALSVEMILELHKILTEKTLPEKECGKLRTSKDDINVWDHRDGTLLHTPPDAKELQSRLKKICHFANIQEGEQEPFIHPVNKAIILHFMLAYDHPFTDGNGRTARALFYWYLSRSGYWLIEFISISRILKEAPAQYAKAFLYTETDDNDITYFIIHQLNTIWKALKALYEHLEVQTREIREVEQLLYSKSDLHFNLNYRQIALLKHALKHPKYDYSIGEHQLSHNVTYETARSDLLKLNKLKLFSKKKVGKALMFTALSDLKNKLKNA